MSTFKFLLTVFIFFGLFSVVSAHTPKRNSLIFFDYDDWVEVYVDGKKVSRIAAKYQKKEEEMEVDLNPFLKDGENHIVEVRIYNSSCKTCSRNEWKVGFEVYQDGESVDYVYEHGDEKSDKIEMKYSITYEWGYI